MEERTAQESTFDRDLNYMMENTQLDMGFLLRTLSNDNATYTYLGDVQKNLYLISENMRARFGYERNLVPDLPREWMRRIYNPNKRAQYCRDIRDLMEQRREIHDMRYQVVDKDGEIFWLHATGLVKWNEDRTQPLLFCGKLTRQDVDLLIDPVSGFACESNLLRHLQTISGNGRQYTCVGFRLNNMAKINSAQGRSLGNRLIHNIAVDLTRSCSAQIPFYRLEGIRFIAILNDRVPMTAAQLADRIRELVEENYRRLGIPSNDACSFAALDFPMESMEPIDFLQQLIAMVDITRRLPDAPPLSRNAELVSQVRQRSDMELMLSKDVLQDMAHFRIVVQPIVSSETGRIMGGEALIRWRKDGVDISPESFVPILEKNNLIQPVGRWVFEQAVRACKAITAFRPDFYLSVNISLRQMYDPTVLDFIPRTLEQYGLSPDNIVLEMTERCMDGSPQRILDLFDMCREHRIRVALDDFGTGYSSMRVLMKYPISVVKVDRSLLLEMTESERNHRFLTSMVSACHQFGKKICIEGVETEEQRQAARSAGCELIQGFYYHGPTELGQLMELLQSQTEP